MRLKGDIRLDSLRPQIVVALLVVQEVCREFEVECVITSGSDGQHSARSLHYAGAALDFRTRELESDAIKSAFAAQVRQRLTADFDVVLEPTHLHVEIQERWRA